MYIDIPTLVKNKTNSINIQKQNLLEMGQLVNYFVSIKL